MARDVPSNDALAVTAELMEDGKTAHALRRVSAEAAKGEPLAFLLEKERSVSPMFPLTIRHVPEKALPEELGNLATLFRGRAAIATRKAGVTWEILILLSLWFFIGMVALSMALPLFGSVGPLGGG
jgi:type II secretory pathway component PulF